MRRLGAVLLVAASALTIGAGNPSRGVVYARGQRLDVHLPSTAAPPGGRPAVVLVHGGGWRTGSRTWWTAQARRLAARGFVAFTIDYRLAPAHPFPAALDDVRAAVRWVRAHADEYGVDRDRIALLGGSAGGNLALLAATTGAPVRGAAAWSAPTDLTALRGDVRRLVTDYLGCTCPARARTASPAAHLDRGDPPLFVANASRELIPLAQATAFAAAASKGGVELHVVPGRGHSTEYGERIWPATVRFLERVLVARA